MEQFQRRERNWCWHSEMADEAPTFTEDMKPGCFLQNLTADGRADQTLPARSLGISSFAERADNKNALRRAALQRDSAAAAAAAAAAEAKPAPPGPSRDTPTDIYIMDEMYPSGTGPRCTHSVTGLIKEATPSETDHITLCCFSSPAPRR